MEVREQAEAGSAGQPTDLLQPWRHPLRDADGRVPFKGESAISIGINTHHHTAPRDVWGSSMFVGTEQGTILGAARSYYAVLLIRRPWAKNRDPTLSDRGGIDRGASRKQLRAQAKTTLDLLCSAQMMQSERSRPPSPTTSKHQTAVRPGKKRGRTSDSGLAAGLAALALTGGGGWYFLDNKPGTLQSLTSPLTRKKRQLLAAAELCRRRRSLLFPPGNKCPVLSDRAGMARKIRTQTERQGRYYPAVCHLPEEAEQAIARQQPQTRRMGLFLNQGLSD